MPSIFIPKCQNQRVFQSVSKSLLSVLFYNPILSFLHCLLCYYDENVWQKQLPHDPRGSESTLVKEGDGAIHSWWWKRLFTTLWIRKKHSTELEMGRGRIPPKRLPLKTHALQLNSTSHFPEPPKISEPTESQVLKIMSLQGHYNIQTPLTTLRF